jgi:hypothetical protein
VLGEHASEPVGGRFRGSGGGHLPGESGQRGSSYTQI